jgi:hypothetical protein
MIDKSLKILIDKLELQCQPGRKHDLYILYIDGQRIGQFGISRSSKEKHLPNYAQKQLKIDKTVFEKVLECTFGKQEVKQSLQKNGII